MSFWTFQFALQSVRIEMQLTNDLLMLWSHFCCCKAQSALDVTDNINYLSVLLISVLMLATQVISEGVLCTCGCKAQRVCVTEQLVPSHRVHHQQAAQLVHLHLSMLRQHLLILVAMVHSTLLHTVCTVRVLCSSYLAAQMRITVNKTWSIGHLLMCMSVYCRF